jgi:hypothetical protein
MTYYSSSDKEESHYNSRVDSRGSRCVLEYGSEREKGLAVVTGEDVVKRR